MASSPARSEEAVTRDADLIEERYQDMAGAALIPVTDASPSGADDRRLRGL